MTSTLNTLKSNSGSRKKKLRKGRGIAAGQGASCGFGMRGQKSRSGRPTRPGFEGGQMPLYRRVPKLKHFEIINQKNFSIINLEKLNDENFRCVATFNSPENGFASQTEIPDEVAFTFKLMGYEGPAGCNGLNQPKLRKCWELETPLPVNIM